jgi:hypothetical protein
MSKDKIADYDGTTAGNNTDIGGISIAEGMLPSAVNNSIRELTKQLGAFADGTDGIDVLNLHDDDASASIKIQAPSTVTTTTTLTLPDGDGDSGQTLVTNGSGTLSWHAPYGNRNLIINGAMQVAQRGTSATFSTSSEGYLVADRFAFSMNGTSTVYTASQDTTAPDGFANSLKLDCTTADASLSAGDFTQLHYRIEGQDLQQLQKGTSGAKKVTISFYVRSPKTGTHILEIQDRDNTRSISKAYTVSSANTFEYKEVTFDGDTSGALNNDNGESFRLTWWLQAGSTYTSGTLATSWESTTSANRAVGQVNIGDDAANNFFISGIQMELGEQATPFEHRSYADELLRCQRYAVVYSAASSGNETYIGSGTTIDVDDVLVVASLPNNLRATPTVTFTNFGVRTAASYTYNNTINNIFPPVGGNTIGFNIDSADTPYTAGQAVLCVISAGSSNHLTLDAEL